MHKWRGGRLFVKSSSTLGTWPFNKIPPTPLDALWRGSPWIAVNVIYLFYVPRGHPGVKGAYKYIYLHTVYIIYTSIIYCVFIFTVSYSTIICLYSWLSTVHTWPRILYSEPPKNGLHGHTLQVPLLVAPIINSCSTCHRHFVLCSWLQGCQGFARFAQRLNLTFAGERQNRQPQLASPNSSYSAWCMFMPWISPNTTMMEMYGNVNVCSFWES